MLIERDTMFDAPSSVYRTGSGTARMVYRSINQAVNGLSTPDLPCSNRSAGRGAVAKLGGGKLLDSSLLHLFFCVGKWTCSFNGTSELTTKMISSLMVFDSKPLQSVGIARGGTERNAKCRPIRLLNPFWRIFRIRI